MRSLVFCLLGGVLLGTTVGVLGALWRWSPWDQPDSVQQALFAAAQVKPSSQEVPRAVIDHREYDMGRVLPTAPSRHEFRIRNEGNAPLDVQVILREGRGTVYLGKKRPLQPGEEDTITVQWTPMAMTPVNLLVQVVTNDPQNRLIPLRVRGFVVPPAQGQPPYLDFRVDRGQGAKAEVEIRAFHLTRMEVERMEFRPQETARYFRARVLPGGKTTAPEKPRSPQEAKTFVKLEVELLPGLPPGRYTQKLLVFLQGEPKPVVVTIDARVRGPFTAAGPGWQEDQEVFLLGRVVRSQGRQFLLHVIQRSQQPATLKVTQVSPKFLQVELLGPEKIPNKDSWRWPLKVKIPPGQPLGQYVGGSSSPEGRIVIKTTDPLQPELVLRLRFAIVSP